MPIEKIPKAVIQSEFYGLATLGGKESPLERVASNQTGNNPIKIVARFGLRERQGRPWRQQVK